MESFLTNEAKKDIQELIGGGVGGILTPDSASIYVSCEDIESDLIQFKYKREDILRAISSERAILPAYFINYDYNYDGYKTTFPKFYYVDCCVLKEPMVMNRLYEIPNNELVDIDMSYPDESWYKNAIDDIIGVIKLDNNIITDVFKYYVSLDGMLYMDSDK